MPGRVPPRPEVQPAEVPARMATAGVPAGRTPAGRVPASRVASSASVLRHCGGEETDHAQQNRKDLRRPHKEGNSSGHGFTTPGNVGFSLLLMGCSPQRTPPPAGLRAGIDVRTVQERLGHGSLATTQKYLEPSTEKERQLEAMRLPF